MNTFFHSPSDEDDNKEVYEKPAKETVRRRTDFYNTKVNVWRPTALRFDSFAFRSLLMQFGPARCRETAVCTIH